MVSTDWRVGGGVLISDKSLAPNNENWSVLGIGVALKVRVSIFSLNSFSAVSLDEISSVSLMNRMDKKFVFKINRLQKLIA